MEMHRCRFTLRGETQFIPFDASPLPAPPADARPADIAQAQTDETKALAEEREKLLVELAAAKAETEGKEFKSLNKIIALAAGSLIIVAMLKK